MTQMAHRRAPSLVSARLLDLLLGPLRLCSRKTVVAECRQRPSSSMIITLRPSSLQGNDSRRLQLSDAPPKLYPTCYPLDCRLAHRARDALESHIQARDMAKGTSLLASLGLAKQELFPPRGRSRIKHKGGEWRTYIPPQWCSIKSLEEKHKSCS